MFLRTFPAIYGELLKIFTVREVAGFVRETLGSLPTTLQTDCPLEAVKLQCIAKTVEGQLYINPGKTRVQPNRGAIIWLCKPNLNNPTRTQKKNTTITRGL